MVHAQFVQGIDAIFKRLFFKHNVFDYRDLETISEGSEIPRFWVALGGKVPYANSVQLQDEDKGDDARLYECSNASGNFRCDQISNFDQNDLDEDDVMLLDTSTEVKCSLGFLRGFGVVF